MIKFILFEISGIAIVFLFQLCLFLFKKTVYSKNLKNFVNSNYLGHEFHSRNVKDLPNDLYCKMCNIKIYIIKNKDPFTYYNNIKYVLTCQEQQIKNLLE